MSCQAAMLPAPAQAAQASPRTRRELAPAPAETRTRHFTPSHNWYLNLTPHSQTYLPRRPLQDAAAIIHVWPNLLQSCPPLLILVTRPGDWRLGTCLSLHPSSVSAGLRGSPPASASWPRTASDSTGVLISPMQALTKPK